MAASASLFFSLRPVEFHLHTKRLSCGSLLLATAVSSVRALLAFVVHAQLADRRQLPIQVELHMSSNRTVTSFNRACVQSTAFVVAVKHLIDVSRQSCVCPGECADAGSLCVRKVLPQLYVDICARCSSITKASAIVWMVVAFLPAAVEHSRPILSCVPHQMLATRQLPALLWSDHHSNSD